MTGPSTYEARVGSIAHIPCTFKADKLPPDPKYFAVVWHLEEKYILSYDDTVTTDPRYSLDKDQALNGIAHLTISNTFVSDGGTYTCSVTDSPVRREKEIKVKISVAGLQMTGPSTYEARVGSIAHIPCTFTADKLPADPKYFTVFWYLKGKHIITYDKTVTSTDPRYSLDKDRALNGNASLTISNPSVSDGGLYTCSVNYSSFPMEREISMSVSARPLLSILSKSVQRNRENTLTCMANGFFPNDIDVTWCKDGEVLKNQFMGKSLKYNNGTYQVNSTVTITPSDDDQNRTFSCRIQHVSLQEPLQKDFQLSYEESSSHVVIIIGIVIAVVLIIGIIAAVILCRRKQKRKASDRSPPDGKDTRRSVTFLEQISGQQVNDNKQSIKDREENQGLLNIKKEDEKNSSNIATYPKLTPNKPHRSVQKTGSKSPGSSEEPLSEIHLQSPGQHSTSFGVYSPPSTVKQKPELKEGEKKCVTLPPVSSPQKDNPETAENRQMPDPEVGEITVPELIAGQNAKLSCRLCNYIHGKHNVSWHVKVKSTGNVLAASYDGKKHPSIENVEASKDPNTRIAYLALLPVEKYDDGSEFILKVDLPDSDRVIERITRPVRVKERNQIQGKMKDQCTESPTTDILAEINEPQSSDQQQTYKPENETLKESYEEQPKSPVKVEKKDNTDAVLALVSSSSKLELDDQVKFTNLDNMEEKKPKQNPPHPPYTEENIGDSSLMGKDHKVDESLGSQTPNQEEMIDSSLPIDISSPKLEGGDTEELTFLDNTDVKDLTQNSALPPM
ncbi:uncharacterized protein LOC120922643 [Rana temporaria]|uniref:uncharacterized protein LOC120922643 n=1 Tax=Rana temporaria TaxID=8407 RepID=UPI001AAD0F02|nr:uncharacterized protein LOC120922643 [Rana temporaria]